MPNSRRPYVTRSETSLSAISVGAIIHIHRSIGSLKSHGGTLRVEASILPCRGNPNTPKSCTCRTDTLVSSWYWFLILPKSYTCRRLAFSLSQCGWRRMSDFPIFSRTILLRSYGSDVPMVAILLHPHFSHIFPIFPAFRWRRMALG